MLENDGRGKMDDRQLNPVRTLQLENEKLRQEIRQLRSENEKAWRERNDAVTRVKEWERIMCRRMLENDGRGKIQHLFEQELKKMEQSEEINIIKWPVIARPIPIAAPGPDTVSEPSEDMGVDEAFELALEHSRNLKDVLIIGVEFNGEMYAEASSSLIADNILLMERLKAIMLQGINSRKKSEDLPPAA